MSISPHWQHTIKKLAANADEFLHYIDPHGPFFGNYHLPGGWVFRGQKNEGFKLCPSGYRSSTLMMTPEGRWMEKEKKTVREQIYYEAVTLLYFCGLADQSGLTIPEDTFANRKLLRRILYHFNPPTSDEIDEEFSNGTLQWPPDEILSLVALAQHYGIPTRLLDWSHDPYTAAYFGVVKTAEMLSSEEIKPTPIPDICVWGLSILNLKSSSLYGQDDLSMPEVVTFTSPAATNANLAAQKGWFTLHRPSLKNLDDPFQAIPLEDVLQDLKYRDLSYPERPVLYKISLPASEAPRVLRLLAHRFVSGARLYPGFDGVVQGLTERRFWDKPKDV